MPKNNYFSTRVKLEGLRYVYLWFIRYDGVEYEDFFNRENNIRLLRKFLSEPDDITWRRMTSSKEIKCSIFTQIPSCDTSTVKGDKYQYFHEKIIINITFEESGVSTKICHYDVTILSDVTVWRHHEVKII